jgi:hypothetical protein
LAGSARVTGASRQDDIDFAIKIIPENDGARLREIFPVYQKVAADSRR